MIVFFWFSPMPYQKYFFTIFALGVLILLAGFLLQRKDLLWAGEIVLSLTSLAMILTYIITKFR